MAESYQNEIPKARINITLDVEIDGACKKKELPLKMLVLGDFSNGKTTGPVADRDRINVNKNNFNSVLKDMSPEINVTVPNRIKNDDSDIRVDLKIDSLKQFHPEQITKQVPELQRLIAMRNLIKDLKSNVLDNASFRRELEKIVKDEHALKALQHNLKQSNALETESLSSKDQGE